MYIKNTQMTRKEFEKIEKEYKAETERWSKLYIGQEIYITDMWLDYFRCFVKNVDVDERILIVIDTSHALGYKETKLSYFYTKEELEHDGIVFEPLTEKEKELVESLKNAHRMTFSGTHKKQQSQIGTL